MSQYSITILEKIMKLKPMYFCGSTHHKVKALGIKGIAECYLFNATDSIHCFLLLVFSGIFQMFRQPRTLIVQRQSDHQESLKVHPSLIRRNKFEEWKGNRIFIIIKILISVAEVIIVTSSTYLPFALNVILTLTHLLKFSDYTNLLLNLCEHILPIQNY